MSTTEASCDCGWKATGTSAGVVAQLNEHLAECDGNKDAPDQGDAA